MLTCLNLQTCLVPPVLLEAPSGRCCVAVGNIGVEADGPEQGSGLWTYCLPSSRVY